MQTKRSGLGMQLVAATNGRNFRRFLLMQQFEAQEIGARIKQARLEAGLTQEELAALSSVSKRSLADYEAGQTIPYRHFREFGRLLKSRPNGFSTAARRSRRSTSSGYARSFAKRSRRRWSGEVASLAASGRVGREAGECPGRATAAWRVARARVGGRPPAVGPGVRPRACATSRFWTSRRRAFRLLPQSQGDRGQPRCRKRRACPGQHLTSCATVRRPHRCQGAGREGRPPPTTQTGRSRL